MGYIDEVEEGFDRYFDALLRERDKAESAAYEAWVESEIEREYREGIRTEEEDEEEYERAAAGDEYDRY